MVETAAGSVTLRALEPLAQVDLRVNAGRLALPLPTAANTTADHGGRSLLWLGPDEWLVVAPDGLQGQIERELREALARAGTWGSVVDVSGQRAGFELAGPLAGDVLAKGCSLDLHPRSFGPARCAQTLLARASVILWRPEAPAVWRILVSSSFAPYLGEWLHDAVEEHRTHP